MEKIISKLKNGTKNQISLILWIGMPGYNEYGAKLGVTKEILE